ncbi:hypothetical protein Tco_1217351 [Tanacetum coccineum]
MAALQYKDDHNRIAYLGRERGSEDFTDILSYLTITLRSVVTESSNSGSQYILDDAQWHTLTCKLMAILRGERIPLTPPMIAIAAAGMMLL